MRQLRAGGVIAYPTEAVFGLGCDPFNPEAVGEILKLKNRSTRKGLILIAADFGQIEGLLAPLPPDIEAKMLASWPGPTTWIVPASPNTPDHLFTRNRTIAVRVTAHGLSRSLCSAFGRPIVSTSANPSGRQPARSALKTRRYFPHRSIMYLPGATGGRTQPSAIFDALSGARLR